MEFKTLEIRDEGTCVPALAIRMHADNSVQAYYIHRRSGYPSDGSSIMLMRLSDGKATNDPCGWPALGFGPRTMPIAHLHIIENFAKLADGDVVDTEYLLKESTEPKVSERF